jgi:hypothetical protein
MTLSRVLPSAGRTLADLPHAVGAHLEFFSPEEYLIMRAVGERIIGQSPSSGTEAARIDIALRADGFLLGADPEIQEQFHQLLRVFNSPMAAFLFDLRFESFLSMSDADRDEYLFDWMQSSLNFRRTAFQALKRTSVSMFYSDSRTWKEIGYDGMFLPEDRP